jgi:hypothetical protein
MKRGSMDYHFWIFTLKPFETSKVVRIKNVPLGILKIILQILVILFVVFYQLWLARGYQEFATVETSLTTKVKGISM